MTFMNRLKFPPPRVLMALAVVVISLPSPVAAQFYFGKNKVQYTSFDWQVMVTDHFRVYFYKEESEIAGIAASVAEESYEVLSAKFNHEVSKLIPLIIYSSPSYFSQTNVIPGLLPESVAGFTEFLKGRVVVPFNGSYFDFAHVIRHELVHVFTLSRLSAALDRNPRVKDYRPPLWFIEGLAEFWSKDWDAEADMIVRDMVVSGRLFTIPNLYKVRGTYFMYKLGESICHFIDSTYGADKIARLFDNWHKGRNFDDVVKVTLGDNLSELSDKWEYSLKKKYFPAMKELGLPDMESKKITSSGYSTKGVPIRWDDGNGVRDWVIYKANVMGYSGIYARPLDGKGGTKTLLKGGRSSDFESLYLLRSGIDANDSGQVVFSSKSKERDVIYLYDLNRGRVTNRYEFDDLIVVRSPRLSPDGSQVAFSGVAKDGYADLYLLDLKDSSYRAVTDDHYYDTDPCFTLNGRSLVFVSDRNNDGPVGATNLYSITLADGSMTQLTWGNYHDQSPDCSKNGIYFSSQRDDGYNIFLLDDRGRITRKSSYITGAFNPRVISDGSSLLYTGYQNLQFQIFQTKLEESHSVATTIKPDYRAWFAKRIKPNYREASMKYDTDYSFDIAQSSVGYDPVYGSIGGIQASVSDVLGNKAYYFLVTNTSETKDDFLESFNFGVTFINRERRLNWGLGAFHLFDEYFNDFDNFYTERQAGIITLLSYPISKFHRVDLTTVARYSDKRRFFGLSRRQAFLITHYISWIYDNSLWDITGPIEGRKYNFSLGITTSIGNEYDYKNFNRMAMIDVRHYFRLGMFSAFANRLFAYTSAGREPQRIYFGGSWSFRGFDRRDFYNRNILFASNELRYPLIDNLLIGFPFGGLGFRSIRGALFFDVGSAWDDDFDQFYGSFGTGFRISLANIILLRFDFTRTTDFETISESTDFDFFFGWNF